MAKRLQQNMQNCIECSAPPLLPLPLPLLRLRRQQAG